MVVLNQMIVLCIMMGIGYFLMKKNYIDDHFNKKMNFLVLQLTLPCLILASVFGENETSQKMVFQVLVIGLIYFMILPVVAYIVVKILRVEKSKQGLFMFMTIFSNSGFMGIPVIAALFGNTGVIYAAIMTMLFNICLFTYGVFLFGLDSEEGIEINLKSLMTPGVLSSVIALILYFFRIPLPEVLISTFDYVGAVTVPLAMILIGASLTAIPMKEIVVDYSIYPFVFIRQILIPLLAFPIVNYLIDDQIIKGVILLSLAMPVGTSVVMFATQYGGDTVTASKTVLLTTVLSVITIPFIATLL